MKTLLFLILFSIPNLAFAQWNFWFNQNKCQGVRSSCLAFKKAGCHKSGEFIIDPDGLGENPPFKAYCDQETDGGGWTLVAYAGTINSSKIATTGTSNFQPLFNNFGTLRSSLPLSTDSNKPSFSRVDLVLPIASNSSLFLVKRTSVPSKMITFNMANKSWWGGTTVTPASAAAIPSETPLNAKMTITGNSGWVVKTPTFWTLATGMTQFQGISWNVHPTDNCDSPACPRSFNTYLNKRSILYWSSDNGGTHDTLQWFHGCPMTLDGCTGPINNYQDFEFYFKE